MTAIHLHSPAALLACILSFFAGVHWKASRFARGGITGVVGHWDAQQPLPVAHSHNPDGTLTKRVMIPNGRVPHLTGFSGTHLLPGHAVPLHRHKTMHEVFYVLDGAGAFNIGGQRHPVRSGSFVHLAPGEEHSIEPAAGNPAGLKMIYFGVATDE